MPTSRYDGPVGRWLVVLFALGACGRFGFSGTANGDGGGGDDAPVPDARPGSCDRFTAITVGHRSTCMLDTSGQRWCAGQYVGLPVPMPNVLTTDGQPGWSKIHETFYKGQGLIGGTVIEWGNDNETPYLFDADGDWDRFYGEFQTMCRIKSTGAMTCGMTPIAGSWASASASQVGFCGVQTNGTAWCWGANLANDLGLGVEPDMTTHPTPVQVGTDTDWVEVQVAEGATCGRKTNGTLWCWGNADLTGNNQVDSFGVPAQVGTRTDWTQVESHWRHSCGVHTDGRVDCWGSDEFGLEVAPGVNFALVPTDLGITVEEFHAGGHHNCAKMAGVWYCWGRNDEGQLGVGTNLTTTSPTTTLCPQ